MLPAVNGFFGFTFFLSVFSLYYFTAIVLAFFDHPPVYAILGGANLASRGSEDAEYEGWFSKISRG